MFTNIYNSEKVPIYCKICFCVYIRFVYNNYKDMKKYLVPYIWLVVIFIFGCSTASNERIKDINLKVNELSNLTQALEKRIDDLSRSVSLIVNDGNELHNKMDDVKNSSKEIKQKFEEAEVISKNLNERINNMETNYKAIDEDFKKRMDDIQKAEIDLSNRLEMMNLGIKEEVKDKAASPTAP
ncbi:MAG: hypothetical protein A3G70_00390 [Planctomycetes bacterium RIFCSPLOWO2_12_FULL_39_13]|nr:MAG: hypothetical protein A3G70_00390 [Planctomycetes bacterium RIFCSPLOWO2_12_FULL_39_13]